MTDNHALVADLAIALADAEEVHAIAILAQVYFDGIAGHRLYQSTLYVVNLRRPLYPNGGRYGFHRVEIYP